MNVPHRLAARRVRTDIVHWIPRTLPAGVLIGSKLLLS
jgi:hypothetical protein